MLVVIDTCRPWLAGGSKTRLATRKPASPTLLGHYQRAVNKILDRIVELSAGREVVLGGDFNLTISEPLDSGEPASKQDAAIQARLRDELGLANCWRTANSTQPLAQTLRWTGNPAKAYHCDGLFVPASWKDRIRSCVVEAGWEELSDHNPVVAEVE